MNSLKCEGPFILCATIWAVKVLVDTLHAVWFIPHLPPKVVSTIAYGYPGDVFQKVKKIIRSSNINQKSIYEFK